MSGSPALSRTGRVLAEVDAERARQTTKHGDQSHLPDGTGPDAGPWWLARTYGRTATHARDTTDAHSWSQGDGTVTYADILLEEVFEALAEDDQAGLRAELIQVAAVAVQWVETIDRRAEVTP